MSYQSYIEKAKLINEIDSTSTTGDIEYGGTALEICEKDGNELFHIVVDKKGELQMLFLSSGHNFRLSLALMEDIIQKARQIVKKIE
jgi:hypothetical protein